MNPNESWDRICSLLLGNEIGDLEQYRSYLLRYVDEPKSVTSTLSGKTLTISAGIETSSSPISAKTKYLAHDELDLYEKKIRSLPFDIDSIKDVDSAISALEERFYYAGNIVLGNSREIQNSTRCSNSTNVYSSQEIYDGQNIVYSCNVRFGEYIFGCNSIGESKFIIKGYDTYQDSRCMEIMRVYSASDCYYAANLEGCTNCMFSFNQRNKSNLIGNLAFSKERYSELKSKLLSDIRDTLKSKKTVPTMIELIQADEGES